MKPFTPIDFYGTKQVVSILFRPYSKIPAFGEFRESLGAKEPWVALEKVHGAQLVIAARAGLVLFGKRKAWLSDGDPFFGWQLLRVQLSAAVQRFARAVAMPTETVYFYGELFGGHYPHPDVPAIPGMSPVQTGIWYAPDLRWAPFDVLVATSDNDDGVFLAHHELELMARDVGLMTPPILCQGTRSEMNMVPTRSQTRIPSLLGLPPIENNMAEGVVIKSAQRGSPGERASIKRKIPEFNESRFDESEAWNSRKQLALDDLVGWAWRLINDARIASALSKLGHVDASQVLDEVELDVRVDLELAFPAACQSLSPAAEERLVSQIRAKAMPLVQKRLGALVP